MRLDIKIIIYSVLLATFLSSAFCMRRMSVTDSPHQNPLHSSSIGHPRDALATERPTSRVGSLVSHIMVSLIEALLVLPLLSMTILIIYTEWFDAESLNKLQQALDAIRQGMQQLRDPNLEDANPLEIVYQGIRDDADQLLEAANVPWFFSKLTYYRLLQSRNLLERMAELRTFIEKGDVVPSPELQLAATNNFRSSKQYFYRYIEHPFLRCCYWITSYVVCFIDRFVPQ